MYLKDLVTNKLLLKNHQLQHCKNISTMHKSINTRSIYEVSFTLFHKNMYHTDFFHYYFSLIHYTQKHQASCVQAYWIDNIKFNFFFLILKLERKDRPTALTVTLTSPSRVLEFSIEENQNTIHIPVTQLGSKIEKVHSNSNLSISK